MLNDPRLVLERLCAERGEDFAGLSRMLGRNPAYIQQFVRRGVPKRLGEEERRKLARYFSVSETLLGGPPEEVAQPAGLLSVKRHPVTVSAGPGAIVTEELGKPYFAFDERWLKALTASQPTESCRSFASRAIRWLRRSTPATKSWSTSAMRPTAARRHLRAADRRCGGGEADRAQSDRAAGDGPIGQSGLSRTGPIAALNEIKLHRPRDLGRPADRLAPLRRRSISQISNASTMPIPVPISIPFIGLPIGSPQRKPARMKRVRKHPPARAVPCIARPWQSGAGGAKRTWSTLR